MLDSSFTWGPHIDMIISRTKHRLAQLCRLSPYLDSVGLSIMYKSFVRSSLEYGHLLYFGAAKGYLKRLDALQSRAASICHSTFPSLESRRHALVSIIRVVVICSHLFLTLLHPLLGDPPASIICQILPKRLDCKILLLSGLWTVTVEVGTVQFRQYGTLCLLIYYHKAMIWVGVLC